MVLAVRMAAIAICIAQADQVLYAIILGVAEGENVVDRELVPQFLFGHTTALASVFISGASAVALGVPVWAVRNRAAFPTPVLRATIDL